MKLLLICVATAICLHQEGKGSRNTVLKVYPNQRVCGVPVERDETEQGVLAVVAVIREFLTSLQNGARLKTVELGAETIIDNVDAILGASETTVTKSDAQDVIDSVVGLIFSDANDENLKATDYLDRQFSLLGALTTELENATSSGDEKNILSVLLAIRTTANTLLETAEETGNEVVIYYEPDDKPRPTETEESAQRAISKRRTCLGIGWRTGCFGIGWGKRNKF